MSPMLVAVVTGCLVALFTSLITYFITTRNINEIVRKVAKEIADDAVNIHNQIGHNDIEDMIDKKIKDHYNFCSIVFKEQLRDIKSDIKLLFDKFDELVKALYQSVMIKEKEKGK